MSIFSLFKKFFLPPVYNKCPGLISLKNKSPELGERGGVIRESGETDYRETEIGTLFYT